MKNSPNENEWFHIIHINHYNYYFVQIAIAFTREDATMYKRVYRNSSSWGSWMFFSPGTATAAQVLKGYTFSSAAGSNLTGTYDPGDQYNNGYNAGYSAGNSNGYNSGYNAGKNAALTLKTLTGTTGTSPGTATYTDETGKTKKVQYRTASYNISGTIHAIYMHVSNSVEYPSLYTRASGTIFTAQRATGYCIFKAQSPAYINNNGFNLPIYAASGPGSKTFSYTIWYSS